MSAVGQSRRFDVVRAISGLPLQTDILRVRQHVSKVPKSDIDSITIHPLRWQGW
jgi:hypothetical protein